MALFLLPFLKGVTDCTAKRVVNCSCNTYGVDVGKFKEQTIMRLSFGKLLITYS